MALSETPYRRVCFLVPSVWEPSEPATRSLQLCAMAHGCCGLSQSLMVLTCRVWWAAACTEMPGQGPGWPRAQVSPAVPASAPCLPEAGLSLKQDTVLGSASAFSFCSFRRRLWWWRPWSTPPVICNHRPMWWWIGPWWQMILVTDTKPPRAAASNAKPKWDLPTVIIIYVTVMVTICSWSSYVPPPTRAQSTF